MRSELLSELSFEVKFISVRDSVVINELTDVGFLMIGVDNDMLVYVVIISLEFAVTASCAGLLASV